MREIAEKYYEVTLKHHTNSEFLEKVGMTKEEFLNKKELVVDIMCDWVCIEFEEISSKLVDNLDKYDLEKYLLREKNIKTLKRLEDK